MSDKQSLNSLAYIQPSGAVTCKSRSKQKFFILLLINVIQIPQLVLTTSAPIQTCQPSRIRRESHASVKIIVVMPA